MFNWKAENQILLDENVGGKGRHFSTRFLEPGLVKYSFGVCLLEKETIDRFIYNFVGCPVIINHKDVTNESAKDDRVGVISRVWFNETDGWYWGEGVIFEQEALDLIDKGYNVSCQYEINEYSSTGGIHNGNEYDKVILNGKPEHLAIVKNPRYENAMIAVNAIEASNEQEFRTAEDGHVYPYTPKYKAYGNSEGRKKMLVDNLKNLEENYINKLERYQTANEGMKKALSVVLNTYKEEINKMVKEIDESTARNTGDKDGRWITVKGTHIFIKEGQSADEAVKEFINKQQDKSKDNGGESFERVKKFNSPEDFKRDLKKFRDNPKYKVEDIIEGKDLLHLVYDVTGDKPEHEYTFHNTKLERYSDKEENRTEAIYSDEFNDFSKEQILDIIRDEHKTGLDWEGLRDELFDTYGIALKTGTFTKFREEALKLDKNKKAKNNIIQAINEIKETDMFKNLFKKKEKNMDKDEIKSIFMECLTELTASNEAEKKEEVKEEVKEEEKEVAENKCKNEEPDYKKMYEDLKAKCEAKEEKEKAKNAIDEQKELLNSGKVETKIDYITEKRAKELGKELF